MAREILLSYKKGEFFIIGNEYIIDNNHISSPSFKSGGSRFHPGNEVGWFPAAPPHQLGRGPPNLMLGFTTLSDRPIVYYRALLYIGC